MAESETRKMDISKYTFCVMNQSDIFIELREVSYDKTDGKLYYYDPRDDDTWPVERFIRQLHGKDAKIQDYLYFKDGTYGVWKRFAM
jgi:hypothetical protein